VGYWAYTLNNDLNTAQQQVAALQAEHAKLQTDYTTLTGEKEKLNAELTQSKADLEKANTDLTSVRADLSESKQRGEKLDSKIETAGTLAEIFYIAAMSDEESDILKIDRLINESNNQELMEQWDTLTQSPSENAFGAFFDYLVVEIRESLR
jgi:chromosome segregation ATPase